MDIAATDVPSFMLRSFCSRLIPSATGAHIRIDTHCASLWLVTELHRQGGKHQRITALTRRNETERYHPGHRPGPSQGNRPCAYPPSRLC